MKMIVNPKIFSDPKMKIVVNPKMKKVVNLKIVQTLKSKLRFLTFKRLILLSNRSFVNCQFLTKVIR